MAVDPKDVNISNIPYIKDGWFMELNKELWPGQAMGLEVDQVLFYQKSPYQDILVFKSKTYGTVLVLDGVIQCTERDEFSYQEMLSFLPLNSHPNPEKVLIIGGGDGGVAREVSKHPAVKEIVQCEIDAMVVEVSKKYLPNMSKGFSNPKLNLIIGDGFKFMEEHQNEFDVIITDSSDPIGPACVLFEKPYYELMSKALRAGGIIASQGECMWLHTKVIKNVLDFCAEIYPTVDYGFTTIPTYPSGQIGFILCSLNKDTNFKSPVRIFTNEEKEEMDLRYYNEAVHNSAFALPQFVKKELER
ncbi:SRM [Bugula neritina]|uniref:Spermidine synthase n=1 Tax=Bugula neritina TaxID=10212 RepID=A0A7J7JQG8_BUGNE|nr:SRM [Bugula neritina]